MLCFCRCNQFGHIQGFPDVVLLPVQTAVSHFRVRIGTEQQTVQIHLRRFPVGGAFPLLQPVGPAHHLIYRMEAQAGHNLPQILRHIFQIIDHVFRQVFRLHTRSIWQPRAMRGPVPKANSSAPNMAAMATSRPVSILPSTSMRTLSRSLFSNKVC